LPVVESAVPATEPESESGSESGSDSSSSADDAMAQEPLQSPAVQPMQMNSGPHESPDEDIPDASLAERLFKDLGAGKHEQPLAQPRTEEVRARPAVNAQSTAMVGAAVQSSPAIAQPATRLGGAGSGSSPAATKSPAAKEPASTKAMDDLVQRRIAEASQKAERLARQRMEEARQRAESAAQHWRQVPRDMPKDANILAKPARAELVKAAAVPSNPSQPPQLTTFPVADMAQAETSGSSSSSSSDDSSSASDAVPASIAKRARVVAEQQLTPQQPTVQQPTLPQMKKRQAQQQQRLPLPQPPPQLQQQQQQQQPQQQPQQQQQLTHRLPVPEKVALQLPRQTRSQQQPELHRIQQQKQVHEAQVHEEVQFPPLPPAAVSGAALAPLKRRHRAPPEVAGASAGGQEVSHSRKRRRKTSATLDGQLTASSGPPGEQGVGQPSSYHVEPSSQADPSSKDVRPDGEMPEQPLTRQALANANARPKRKPQPEASAITAVRTPSMQLPAPADKQASFELAKGSDRKRSCMDEMTTIEKVIKRYKKKWAETAKTGYDVLLCFSACISSQTAALDSQCPVQDRPILRLKVP